MASVRHISKPRSWYQHNWLINLFSVLLFPIGLVLVWKSPWRRNVKIVATSIVGVMVIGVVTLSLIFAPPSITLTSSLQPVSSNDYMVQGTLALGSDVTVNGQPVAVHDGSFTAHVPLAEGDNHINIVASQGDKQTVEHYTVHRYTKAEIAKQQADTAREQAAIALAAKQKAAAAAAAQKQADAAKAAADKKKADAALAAKATASAKAQAAAQKKAADAAAAAKKKADADAAAAAAKAAAIAAAQPKVVLDVSGSGTKQTQAFTTKSSWAISYAFDCSNFGYPGNFQIFINNTDGSYNTGAGANDLAASGSNVDYYYNDAGQHYLTINSECSWHVIVKS